MNVSDLENEALKLPASDRARLAEALLESLEALSDDENRQLWADEARRRDAELDADPTRGRPAADVFRDDLREIVRTAIQEGRVLPVEPH